MVDICIWDVVLVLIGSNVLLSSLYEIDVRVKFLTNYVWEAENDKIGFFSVGVDSFDQLCLKNISISLPVVKNGTKN